MIKLIQNSEGVLNNKNPNIASPILARQTNKLKIKAVKNLSLLSLFKISVPGVIYSLLQVEGLEIP